MTMTPPVMTKETCSSGLGAAAFASAAVAGTTAATLDLDASEAPRGIERAHLVLPVKPGPLTLLYPERLTAIETPRSP